MQLDLVIPTYNRPGLLTRTLESVLRARRPAGMELRVYVVDNNSGPETRQTIEAFARRAPWLTYVLETKQGLSHARNGGIAAGTGEFVGMIDDDEEIAEDWFEVAARYFPSKDIDFIGGPCRGRWEIGRPAWVPEGWGAVVGLVEPSAEERDFGPDFPGMLTGGNAVVRRALFETVGPYNTSLGRTAHGLASGEDDEMYTRLLAAGGRGRYVPDLVIYHYIPASRLTKSYYRRWCFGHGVSMGELDRARPYEGHYFLGIPRWRIGQALRGLPRLLTGLVGASTPPARFSNELQYWSLLGFAYGKLRSRGTRPVQGGRDAVRAAGASTP